MKAPGKAWMAFILFSAFMLMGATAYFSGVFTFQMAVDLIHDLIPHNHVDH